jgi:hypothetical protein
MDTSKIDPDYDCGDTDNKFSNLPPEEQKQWNEYSKQCEAWAAEQDKKEAAGTAKPKRI